MCVREQMPKTKAWPQYAYNGCIEFNYQMFEESPKINLCAQGELQCIKD